MKAQEKKIMEFRITVIQNEMGTPVVTCEPLSSNPQEGKSQIFDIIVEPKGDKYKLVPYTKRPQTQPKLAPEWIRSTSLPMWLAETLNSFNPDDPTFFDTKIKPLLEKKSGSTEKPDFKRFKHQIDSLKRSLLTNFPELISDNVQAFINQHMAVEATRKIEDGLQTPESLFLKKVQTCLDKKLPKELLKLQRQCKGVKRNKVAVAFKTLELLKPSYTAIVV